MSTRRNLFDVDPVGLAKLLEDRGKGFALVELLSNAWDTDAKRVEVTLTPVPGVPVVELSVEDDDPEGFADLSHAYTLFAESTRKADPTKRGRFNMGEKLVIALCSECEISTTKGTLRFGSTGRESSREKRLAGSRFWGLMKMTRDEMVDALELLRRLIVPEGVTFVVNGAEVPRRTPVTSFAVRLPTVVGDAEGVLRGAWRETTVNVYEPVGTPSLYELGVPVVETGDEWDVDIAMKVPLNMNRDNVTPAYLRQVRTAVLNHTFARLNEENATETWVSEALADKNVTEEAVAAVITARYGEKAVVYDPSDREGSDLAVAAGYTVVHGGAFNGRQWDNIRNAGVLPRAGLVTPSPSAGLNNSDGSPVNIVPESEWTPGEQKVAEYTRRLGEALLGFAPTVEIASSVTYPAAATWCGHTITFNRGRLGRAWFDTITQRTDALILHEFAHNRVHNHLSAEYADEVARLGAKMVAAVVQGKLESAVIMRDDPVAGVRVPV